MSKNRDKRLAQGAGGAHVVRTAVQIQKTTVGPIPSPEDLAQYNTISPDLVGRIVTMAEIEQKNRHANDGRAMILATAGLLTGFAVALGGLAAATYCVATGHPVSGTILGSLDLVAMVSVFVRGRAPRQQKQQLPPSQ